MGKISNLYCREQKLNKQCISDGYMSLSQGKITKDNYFVISAALRNIFETHEGHLRKNVGTKNRYLSFSVATQVKDAFTAHDNEEFSKAIDILKNTLQLPRLSSFEIAYVSRFLGIMYLAKDKKQDKTENKKEAIKYLEKSLINNELGYLEHWETYKLLCDLYIQTEQLDKYIKEVGNYIYNNQKEYDLLPKETILAINKVISDKITN